MAEQTMVERVARAICCAGQNCALGADDRRCAAAEGCKFQARAVIEALREPTEDMLDSTTDELASGPIWRAMIDAALKD